MIHDKLGGIGIRIDIPVNKEVEFKFISKTEIEIKIVMYI